MKPISSYIFNFNIFLTANSKMPLNFNYSVDFNALLIAIRLHHMLFTARSPSCQTAYYLSPFIFEQLYLLVPSPKLYLGNYCNSLSSIRAMSHIPASKKRIKEYPDVSHARHIFPSFFPKEVPDATRDII